MSYVILAYGYMNRFIVFLFVVFMSNSGISQHEDHHKSQHEVYDWDWDKEKYYLGSGVLLHGGILILKANIPSLTASQLSLLDKEDINSFDRSAVNNRNERGQLYSDIISYGSIIIPFTHYLSHHGKEEDFAILGMAAEVYFLNSTVIDGLKVSFRRSRPYTYNTDLPLEERLQKSARYSFPSGHTGNAAAFSFFSAKVFSDLHPNSNWKPFVWGAAIALPATTGYFRYQSGNHFPTDIIVGYMIGATSGYLIPHLHKVKNKDMGIRITPIANGLVLSLRF